MRHQLAPVFAIVLTVMLFATTCAFASPRSLAVTTPLIQQPTSSIQQAAPAVVAASSLAYLPLVVNTPQQLTTRRVNAPYFGSGEVRYSETAIFWFGQPITTSNYADVRVGYNDSELYLQLMIYDRRLWYDPSPSPASLTAWDATSLYLRLSGNTGGKPDSSTYRFDSQLSDWQNPRTDYQAAYIGNGSGWITSNIAYTTESTYRWESLTVGGTNNDQNNRGWTMTYHIPFSSLGLTAQQVSNETWGLATVVHDRDDSAGTPIADKKWPEGLNSGQPSTWGQLHFGLPTFTPPSARALQTITIRQGLNGAIVPDGAVGGTIANQCPGDSTYIWNQWGNANFSGADGVTVQAQGDVADWPCFSKYYVTFPLTSIPPDKVIVSATLTLHLWGGSDPTLAYPSLVQIMTIANDWVTTTLSWNNAPLAFENVSQTWVNPTTFPGWPGIPYTWEVSRAVAQAYTVSQQLRLVLYEADSAYHSGKYFSSSEVGDWDAVGRPTLRVTYGNP